MRILVVYATTQGTTESIALRIRDRLLTHNLGEVELAAVTAEPAPVPQAFDAVVIGSCIHQQAWLKSGADYIKTLATDLSGGKKPALVWAFSVGLPPDVQWMKDLEERKMEKWLRKYIPALKGHTLFKGQWKREGLPRYVRIVLTCLGTKFEDKRDWESMDKWADGIAEELRKVQGIEAEAAAAAAAND